jgi:CheY-like chemotaxis protein
LQHIFSNALEYTTTGEITLQVSVEEERDHEILLKFDIIDTGLLLSPKDRRYLFQMFSQDEVDNGSTYRSAGMRMLVARQLTELLGGEFVLTHTAKEGTKISFSLLFIKRKEVPLQQQINNVELAGLRILIVSDHSSAIGQMVDAMHDYAMNVQFVPDGDSALEYLVTAASEKKHYSVVIMDSKVAGMQDFSLAHIISQDSSLGVLRLILLTDVGNRGDSQKAKAAGITGFLTKPVKKDVLIRCLRTVIALPDSLQNAALVTRHSLAVQQVSPVRSILLGASEHEIKKKVQGLMFRQGYRLDIAQTGPEVMAAIQSRKYTAVVLSIDLVAWDGYETAQAICKRIPLPPPIIGLVAHSDNGKLQKCLNSGMLDCIDQRNLDKLQHWLEDICQVAESTE